MPLTDITFSASSTGVRAHGSLCMQFNDRINKSSATRQNGSLVRGSNDWERQEGAGNVQAAGNVLSLVLDGGDTVYVTYNYSLGCTLRTGALRIHHSSEMFKRGK